MCIVIMVVISSQPCNVENPDRLIKNEKYMPMKQFQYSLPLIDEVLVDELFGVTDDDESLMMQREIWNGIKGSFIPDLEGALAGDPIQLCGALHRIRGYCASSGARQIGELLLAWEEEADPMADSSSFLEEAKRVALLSFAEIEKRHPYLVSPENGDSSRLDAGLS